MARSNEEQLVVLLEARIGDLEKKMAKAEGVTAKAYRNMSRGSRTATASMEKDMTRASRRIEQATASAAAGIGRLAKAYIGPLAAAFAAGIFGKAFIEKTIAQQKAVQQVEAVLRSTGGAAGVTSQAAQDLAASLQKVTTYGDEAILPAESILLTFTKIGKDVFPQATEVVLDMSKALNQDLKSSAIQVGKALQDPILGVTALRRVGVNFDEAQTKVIKKLVETGQQAKAQAMILKELQTEFGGSARAARDTLGGALEALGNAFGDAFELHGPAVDNLQHEIEDLITTVTDPRFTQALADIGAGIFGMIGDTAEAVVTLDQDVEAAIDALHRLEDAIPGSGALGKLEGYIDTFKTYIGGLKNLPALEGAISSVLQDKLAGTHNTENSLIDERINQAFGDQPDVRTTPKTDRVSGTRPSSSSTLHRSSTGSTTTVNALKSEVQQIKERTKALQAMTAAQAGVNPLVDDYGQAVATAQAKQQLLNAAERAKLEITPDLEKSINAVAESYGKAAAASNRLAEAQHKQQENIREWKDTARGALDSFVQGIENGETAWQSMGDAALSVLDRIINKIEDQLVDALFKAGNTGGGVGSIFSGIGSLFGGGGPSAQLASSGGVGLFAKGGIADTPSIFAEAGPEAAVPLPDGRRIPVDLRGQGSGSQSNVHVDVAVSVNQDGNWEAKVTNIAQTQAGQIVTNYDRHVAPNTAKRAVNESFARGNNLGGL